MKSFGVIGVGRWGPNIIGSLNQIDKVHVSHVCDTNEDNLSIISKKFPLIKFVNHPSELFNLTELDALIISTPVITHLDLVDAALNAGKHVFVEKPFGLCVKYCETLCQTAKKLNLHLMVGHVFLFNNAILELKQIISSGELGRILHIGA